MLFSILCIWLNKIITALNLEVTPFFLALYSRHTMSAYPKFKWVDRTKIVHSWSSACFLCFIKWPWSWFTCFNSFTVLLAWLQLKHHFNLRNNPSRFIEFDTLSLALFVVCFIVRVYSGITGMSSSIWAFWTFSEFCNVINCSPIICVAKCGWCLFPAYGIWKEGGCV